MELMERFLTASIGLMGRITSLKQEIFSNDFMSIVSQIYKVSL